MSTQQYILRQNAAAPETEQARLLYITKAQYSEEWDSSLHTHDCAELFLVTGGRGSLHAGSVTVPVTADDFIIVNGGVPHTETSDPKDPMKYIVLGVKGLETRSDPGGYAVLRHFSEQRQAAACMRMLLQEAEAAQPGYEAVCHNLLQIILLLLLRREAVILHPVVPGPKSRECSLVRRYIDSHFKENLTLEQLASMASLSKYYLAHAFQKEYGLSPIRYLTRRRIQESRFLLAETDHSLTHIARVLGFSSLSYFSQAFRRIEGVSPKEYRQNSRGGVKGVEEPEGTDNSAGTEGTKDAKGEEAPEGTERKEAPEGTEDAKKAEGPERTEDAKGAEEPKGTKDAKGAEGSG